MPPLTSGNNRITCTPGVYVVILKCHPHKQDDAAGRGGGFDAHNRKRRNFKSQEHRSLASWRDRAQKPSGLLAILSSDRARARARVNQRGVQFSVSRHASRARYAIRNSVKNSRK
jgi:hypothetical protein